MKRVILITLAAATLAACDSTMEMAPPPPIAIAPPSPTVFRPQDFAWSTVGGSAAIQGALNFRVGGQRYTCAGADVRLTPETPWSRRRMTLLYGSAVTAALPVEQVKARAPSAPNDNYATFVRRATCDGASHFSFAGLPDGGWYVITLARPVSGPGEPVAVMRRVETEGGVRYVSVP